MGKVIPFTRGLRPPRKPKAKEAAKGEPKTRANTMSETCGAFWDALDLAPDASAAVAYFRGLPVPKLKHEVRVLVHDIDNHVTHTTKKLREKLLPALLVLREKVPHGEWENVLRSMGLSPATVRQWRRRERAAADAVAQLLGEPPTRRGRQKWTPPDESTAQSLVRAARRLAQAVVEGRIHYARRLAVEFLSASEEGLFA